MKVDMSPKAVRGRLKLVSQLWRLSIALGKAKKESKNLGESENTNISKNRRKNAK